MMGLVFQKRYNSHREVKYPFLHTLANNCLFPTCLWFQVFIYNKILFIEAMIETQAIMQWTGNLINFTHVETLTAYS